MDAVEREALAARWVEAMRRYVDFLDRQESQNAELAATLTLLELPNLFALLDRVQRAGDPEATIGLATSLYGLLRNAGRPRLLERVGQVRDAAAEALGDACRHARFIASGTRIEQQHAGGRLREALDGARALLRRARAAGERAYPRANYDLAMACFLLARVLKTDAGKPAAAAEAKRKAIACYLAYRRDGGESHSAWGRLFHAVTQALQAGKRGVAEQVIAEYGDTWKDHENPEADALQAIVAGSRDRTLADPPDLHYPMAAEILFLIETLEHARG